MPLRTACGYHRPRVLPAQAAEAAEAAQAAQAAQAAEAAQDAHDFIFAVWWWRICTARWYIWTMQHTRSRRERDRWLSAASWLSIFTRYGLQTRTANSQASEMPAPTSGLVMGISSETKVMNPAARERGEGQSHHIYQKMGG